MCECIDIIAKKIAEQIYNVVTPKLRNTARHDT